jgi:hypothetical protein
LVFRPKITAEPADSARYWADLSDDNAADGTFNSRLTETSLPPDAAPSAGLRGAVATGTDGALTAAVVAAKASASP